jgi:hypothetical protein
MKRALHTCTVWFAELDRLREGLLLGKGKERNQPVVRRSEMFTNAASRNVAPPKIKRNF